MKQQRIKYCNAPPNDEGYRWELLEDLTYFSKRYGKWVICRSGMLSDGATKAVDVLNSISWFIHDKLCNDECWEDGSPCSNRQASFVIYDILKEEGRWFRARTWFIATLLGNPILQKVAQMKEKRTPRKV